MVTDYADTSFLFSLYAQDANSAEARRLGEARQASFAWTAFGRYELHNAFRLSAFRRDLSPEECGLALRNVADDARSGLLVEAPVAWRALFEEAETLSAAHTIAQGLRALDLLHVAAARVLGTTRFYTFDRRQAAFARLIGLKVFPAK